MGIKRVLFLGYQGTLVQGAPEALVPWVIPALLQLQSQGFRLAVIPDGNEKANPSLKPVTAFLESQGILFERILTCPHEADERCQCRKPNLGLVRDYLGGELDLSRSYVIGSSEEDRVLSELVGVERLSIDLRDGELGWKALVKELLSRPRRGTVIRKTKETEISVEVVLKEGSEIALSTGIGYFDHMLEQVAKHGGFGLRLSVKGDLHVDEHHTVEDTALALGEAMRKALGDKRGIGRYGFVIPMDEAEARVSIDLSGRAHLSFKGTFPRETVGELSTEMVSHFFRSLADSLGATLHIEVTGENAHHMVESTFKGLGRALRSALQLTDTSEVPSTKGAL